MESSQELGSRDEHRSPTHMLVKSLVSEGQPIRTQLAQSEGGLKRKTTKKKKRLHKKTRFREKTT